MPSRFAQKIRDVVTAITTSPAFAVAVLVAVCVHLIVYSQTLAYYGDEGFDLVAAQLVAAGQRPYVDFFYQHTPLFTYLTAGWMKLFGQGWRSAHLLPALLTCGSVVMTAAFVNSMWSSFDRSWRVAGVVMATVLFGWHPAVLKFATVGQAYGACLFFSVGAFYAATTAIRRPRAVLFLAAGLCSGAAAASSLLTIPVMPIVLAWLLWHCQPGTKLRTLVWCATGATISLLPLLWLMSAAPRAVLFDIAFYHVEYRRQGWPLHWDWEVLQTLVDPQGMILIFLGLLGFLFAMGLGRHDTSRRDDLTLCASLVMGLAGFAAITRPTFPQYFVTAIPFVAILAAAGVRAIGSRVATPGQQPWLALIAVWPFLLTPVRTTHQLIAHAYRPWEGIERVGQQIDRVTPPDGFVLANQLVYAAAQRLPPSGLESEFSFGHSDEIGRRDSARIASKEQLEEWLRAARFDTVAKCDEDPDLNEDLPRLYRQRVRVQYKESISFCEIFWDPIRPVTEPSRVTR